MGFFGILLSIWDIFNTWDIFIKKPLGFFFISRDICVLVIFSKTWDIFGQFVKDLGYYLKFEIFLV